MTVVHYETANSTFCLIKGDKVVTDVDDSPAILCCEIDGDSWEDCMVKYHEHMNWEPYIPMDDD